MTSLEAEEIINKYWKSIRDLRPDSIVQSSRELPCTFARIKYAHFVYGEELIKSLNFVEGEKIEDMANSCEQAIREIRESYGIIDSLFNEDPEPININYREYLEELKNGVITDFCMPNPFGECNPVMEFHNFLGECWFLKYRTNLFKDNSLGAFIYDAVRNKATKEKDIKTLIKIVNTSLTRNVNYPGKKSNAESVFVK